MQRVYLPPIQYAGLCLLGAALLLWVAYTASKKQPSSWMLFAYQDDASQCDDAPAPAAAKSNPNKLLFISCGGFLE